MDTVEMIRTGWAAVLPAYIDGLAGIAGFVVAMFLALGMYRAIMTRANR